MVPSLSRLWLTSAVWAVALPLCLVTSRQWILLSLAWLVLWLFCVSVVVSATAWLRQWMLLPVLKAFVLSLQVTCLVVTCRLVWMVIVLFLSWHWACLLTLTWLVLSLAVVAL